jgi:hypothetical protein
MTTPVKVSDPALTEFATTLGTALGALVWEVAITCLRAWMLSIAAGLLMPSIALTFWQWITVTIAIRLMFANTISISK